MHARKRNPHHAHESRFARAPINASFLLADRAAPEGFEIRERDPHGAGGAETRGGGKGGKAGAIPAESCDFWQIIAKIITSAAGAAGSSLESDRLELFRFILFPMLEASCAISTSSTIGSIKHLSAMTGIARLAIVRGNSKRGLKSRFR